MSWVPSRQLTLFDGVDAIDVELLRIIEIDARASFTQLAQHVGLTAPSVAERLRRLEDKGAILGYAAVIDPAFLGLSVAASIRLRINGADCGKFAAKVKQWPEIVRLDRLTGDDSHLALALVKDVKHLEQLIDQLTFHRATATSVILDTPTRDGSVLRAAEHAVKQTLRRATKAPKAKD
ncbi:MAG: Lrp/AsnC family transcriptional regulator [Polaromonas sp.]|uniref:Lrp/AsnC family transcriptional regulator n=1 Tax=Polaromonas sp. TaxID=1869339 RepID=UPI0017CC6D7E|nr:Lrp/AsnC family transcriptional regulator [Polaromonas sp.]MBA3595701.1 Lrp/AsnC family transcriptional regulator [Polaromonas sp.]